MTIIGLTVGQWQTLIVVLGIVACLGMLLKNRVVAAKLAVAIFLTAVAVFQCFETPLDRVVAEMDGQLAGMSKSDPKYNELKKRREKAAARMAAARRDEGKWTDLLPFRLGLDLQGGTEVRLRLREDKSRTQALERELALIEGQPGKAEEAKKLRQEIEREQEALESNITSAVDVIRERLNASGLSEIPVTQSGENRVLVQLPGMGEAETEQIIDMLQLQGKLEFRLVEPRNSKEEYGIRGNAALYKKVAANKKADQDLRNIRQSDGEVVAERDIDDRGRDSATGDPLYDWLRTPDVYKQNGKLEEGTFFLVEQVAQIGGEHIIRARAEPDPESGGFRVAIGLDRTGAELFARITRGNVGRQLAIVLDGKLKSAPNLSTVISDGNAVITGNFDRQEAESLATVLKSGSLKVKIEKEFTSFVGPTLGSDSIVSGLHALVAGLVAVVAFMLIYYLTAGVVTNVALALNMLLIIAILSAWQGGATLTLPGIAGLILTIGMAVDANVLIFERIREEREKGNAIGRAIELGYERAFVTIVDANVTTLITALILHSFGTEAVRGFALTLIFGILSSMFCSLVVTRWIFAALLEGKMISELKMLRIFKKPAINFIAMRRAAMTLSIICILVGMGVFIWRGDRNYGHDFNGGTLAQINLTKSFTEDEARDRIRERITAPEFSDVVQGLQSFGAPDEGGKFSQFILRTQAGGKGADLKTADAFKKAIREAFKEELPPQSMTVGREPLAAWSTDTENTFRVDINSKTVSSAKALQSFLAESTELIRPMVIRADQEVPAEPTSSSATLVVDLPAKDKDGKPIKPDALDATLKAAYAGVESELVDFTTGLGKAERIYGDVPAEKMRLRTDLTLKKAVTEKALAEAIKSATDKATMVEVTITNPGGMPEADEKEARAFTILCSVPKRDASGLLRNEAQQERVVREEMKVPVDKGILTMVEPFPRFTSVGGVVAEEMKLSAVLAMLYAIVAIFFYIWLRFQFRAAFGAGAVIALIHDVLITLGALAIADQAGLLNGQIDLKIVAALLTIVGYSLNDTIVVFDRVRENLHGGKKLEEVINDSVNQTISRTVITSLTTLLVVLTLFVLGGDVIRGFAFALFVGVLVGTYSSIFIASPALVELVAMKAWNDKRKHQLKNAQSTAS